MTAMESFKLRNRMLFYNLFTNLVGAWVIILLSFRSISPPFYEIADFAHRINMICIPVFYGLMGLVQIVYEQPIRRYLKHWLAGPDGYEAARISAQRRLLNAPFVIVAIDFAFWTAAAILYFSLYRQFTTIELAAIRVFFQNLLVGLISSTAAFFVLEQVLQKSLVPRLFPEGGLYMTPGTARIRIRTRLTAYLFAVNLIPFLALLFIVQGTYDTHLADGQLLVHMRSAVVTNSMISLSVGICLTILVSIGLSRPMSGIIRALKCVHQGDLEQKVRVTTNDEIGYAGDVINEMTYGLRERERMQHSLRLAREVQVKLLPGKAPRIDGLDIAGKSLYCDETGGDYFDYIRLPEFNGQNVGVVVGDVSDHGVHAALLMTTARAFIRLRASTPDGIEKILADVNRHLAMDIENGGQFMTLFFLVVDLEEGTLNWIRAGHDPALLYDPSRGEFFELMGKGIPLGIDSEYPFLPERRGHLQKGQIILLGTDGIWEARNRKGEIFGKKRFYQVIRQNAGCNAQAILDAVFDATAVFQDGFRIEDDITFSFT